MPRAVRRRGERPGRGAGVRRHNRRGEPLPGGIGAVDTTLVVLIVTVTGLPAATATAAALVFRGATLLFSTVLRGAIVAAMHLRPELVE